VGKQYFIIEMLLFDSAGTTEKAIASATASLPGVCV
jgi:hypothetical protein